MLDDSRVGSRLEAPHDAGEARYLVLADYGVPYLLARVRWPDIAQAISAASGNWIEDAGLFDLPYDPNAVTVSFPQAAAVAVGWGTQLHADGPEDVRSYIRRMPANWSDLSPSERSTWGIESVGRRRPPARRLRALQAKIADASAAARADKRAAAFARRGGGSGIDVAAHGNGQLDRAGGALGSGTDDHRRHVRVRLDGRAHIRCADTTISAGLVDLSERGLRCVLPRAGLLATAGTPLKGPFLLEAESDTSRICLDIGGRISWRRSIADGVHVGVAFDELADDETEGVRRLLVAAARNRDFR